MEQGAAPHASAAPPLEAANAPNAANAAAERVLSPQARLLRAAGLAAVWAFAAAPAAFGLQKCQFAAVFHRPCPGCGMTRAGKMMLAGDVIGSLRMQPLAMPMVAAGGFIALMTVIATYRYGLPLINRMRMGRLSIVLIGSVYAATLLLWILRWFGLFGGPVPVGA
jgi:hypothetical protein